MRIVVVIGVRPHFMKLAALRPALVAEHEVLVVHTGQHFDHELSATFLREFGLPAPDRVLAVGSGSHAAQTGRAMLLVETALVELRPDLVVVIGDSNTTLAGALAAAKLGLPVAHIEAGLRSFDRQLPEEVNRLAIDAVATLHLAPTDAALERLVVEGHGDTAEFVGDLLLDNIDLYRDQVAAARERWLTELPELADSAVVTFHRGETVRDPGRLAAVVDGVLGLGRPVVCVLHPATGRALAGAGLLSRLVAAGVRLLDAQPHAELLALVGTADRVLTDSNGVQREALLMGTPCFVLRESTEYRETLDLGAGALVGTDSALIAACGTAVLDMPDPARVRKQFGDGRAAERTAAAIRNRL